MCLKSTIVKEISVNRGLLGGGSGRIYCTYSVAHMILIGLIRHHLVFFFKNHWLSLQTAVWLSAAMNL